MGTVHGMGGGQLGRTVVPGAALWELGKSACGRLVGVAAKPFIAVLSTFVAGPAWAAVSGKSYRVASSTWSTWDLFASVVEAGMAVLGAGFGAYAFIKMEHPSTRAHGAFAAGLTGFGIETFVVLSRVVGEALDDTGVIAAHCGGLLASGVAVLAIVLEHSVPRTKRQ